MNQEGEGLLIDEKKQTLEPEDAKKCSECKHPFLDRYLRCSLFDNAIIHDIEEKNCES